jgi:ATP-dependent DNA ligase
MPVPAAMLSPATASWPVGEGWVLEPKWDGYRLLIQTTRGLIIGV